MAYVTGIDKLAVRLIYAQQGRWRRVARTVLKAAGIDIPWLVSVGPGLRMPHATTGVVVHSDTVIGERVTLFHNVTIGRADIWLESYDHCHAAIEDDAIICAGAVILLRPGRTVTVGRGTVVGANSVLTQSTGEWEVWAGAPARLIGKREPVVTRE